MFAYILYKHGATVIFTIQFAFVWTNQYIKSLRKLNKVAIDIHSFAPNKRVFLNQLYTMYLLLFGVHG